MRENGKKLLRYDFLVVSLLSSLDCEVVVSGFVWVVLVFVLARWFWGRKMILEMDWREKVRIWKDGLDRKKGEKYIMTVFSHWKVTGVSLPEEGTELLERDPFNSRLWSENRLFWALRLASAALFKDSSKRGMNSGNQEFAFPHANGSATVGKILLVEDTEINRILLRKLFRDLNLLLDEAENGQIAVDYFKQGKNYDLVLMDKEMPVMDGHEATRQLRLLGVKTPIVALTGNSLQSDKDMFFQAGADEFRTKPLSREELVRLLARFGLDGPAPIITPNSSRCKRGCTP